MTTRTHTPEDVQKIMEPWSPVSIGVDITEEGAHVVGIYALDNDTSQVFYAKYYPVPQRTWVGLTDEEVESLQRLAIDPVDANGWGFLNRERYANLIEAKLKEKNT